MPKHSVLLHIGYHKTGSSLLQSALFNQADGPFLLPQDEPRHKLVETFVVPAPMTFDPDKTRSHYAPLITQAEASSKVAVLSHERFSGYPPTGGFDSPIIADRLRKTFPEAAVLIVVREQLSNIRSMYSQYITDGGELSFTDYITQPDQQLKRTSAFTADFYRYDALVQHYQALFGAERVLVLPHEMLREDPAGFIKRICDFNGVPLQEIEPQTVNTARTPVMQMFQRLVNRWFSDNQLSRRPFIRLHRASKRFARTRPFFDVLPAGLNRYLETRLKNRILAEFGESFAESNTRLAKLANLDLSRYEYQFDTFDRTSEPKRSADE